MEKSLVEQIAADQWKLVRLDRSEARIHDPAVPPAEFALAIHRVYLTQVRLQRSISSSIADLDHYRKIRLARRAEIEPKDNEIYRVGLTWSTPEGTRSYSVLPRVRGLDGVWREIPREVLGDFPEPTSPGDETQSARPKPNGQS